MLLQWTLVDEIIRTKKKAKTKVNKTYFLHEKKLKQIGETNLNLKISKKKKQNENFLISQKLCKNENIRKKLD